MSSTVGFRWRAGALQRTDDLATDPHLVAADSWLVSDGATLAIDLHRRRFAGAAAHPDAEPFWLAALRAIPGDGDWFPRVEATTDGQLALRLRPAPERMRSAMLATAPGPDRRTRSSTKGPDLAAMAELRAEVAPLGADEAIILDPNGFVVDGAYSAIVWWRGRILCAPPVEFARVDSVTARSVRAVAAALGHDLHEEAVTPAELAGAEVWVLSALHGIRLARGWIDGPELAEQPGRADAWRRRMLALRRSGTGGGDA